MQQQVNSYTFQLSQNLEKSVLECHVSEPLFYMGARTTNKSDQTSKSYLYRLHFEEQNPRKSQVKKQQIPGSIEGIYSISKDSQDLLLISRDNTGNYSLQRTSFPLLQDQTIRTQTIEQLKQTRSCIISHKQTKRHFLVGERDIYSLSQESLQKGEKLVQIQEDRQITSSVVDPIHQLLSYVIDGKEIIVTDKTLKKYISHYHRQKYGLKIGRNDLSLISSIDYNPNKQYYLMSCHNQCIKFWDIRKPNLPIKVHTQHHSILLNSKYNPSHDQLITCAYDDGTVGLLRMNSVSSSPGQNEDALVKLYDEHQDSVYNIKWTSFSPWIFASLSYGAANVVINFVPSVQKYRILL